MSDLLLGAKGGCESRNRVPHYGEDGGAAGRFSKQGLMTTDSSISREFLQNRFLHLRMTELGSLGVGSRDLHT